MEKVFEPDFVKYLSESGIDNKTIAQIQYNKLKGFVLGKLHQLITYIEEGEFHSAKLQTDYVTCDECGSMCNENHINFGGFDRSYSADFYTIVQHLEDLKEELK